MYYPGEIRDHRIVYSFLQTMKIQCFVSNFTCQMNAMYVVKTFTWGIPESCMTWSALVYIRRCQLVWTEYLDNEDSLSSWRRVSFAPHPVHPGSYYGGSSIRVLLFPGYDVHKFWAILHCTEVVGTFNLVGWYAWLISFQ